MRIAVAALICLTMSSCTTSLSSNLVGTWHHQEKYGIVEYVYKPDGWVIISSRPNGMQKKEDGRFRYKVTGDTIEYFPNKMGSGGPCTIEIDGDTMTLRHQIQKDAVVMFTRQE